MVVKHFVLKTYKAFLDLKAEGIDMLDEIVKLNQNTKVSGDYPNRRTLSRLPEGLLRLTQSRTKLKELIQTKIPDSKHTIEKSEQKYFIDVGGKTQNKAIDYFTLKMILNMYTQVKK